MKKTMITTVALAFLGLNAVAQKYDILGVKRFNVSSMQAITENQEVKGYYSITAMDKAGKRQRNYALSILDNNLKPTYSIEMVKSDKLAMLESSYNGERFCFSFYDARERILQYDICDKTGKAVGQYSLEISKTEAQLYGAMLQTEDDTYQGTLVAVKGKGFIRYGYEKDDGYRITMEMIDNTGAKKWATDSKATSRKSYEAIAPLFTDENVAIVLLTTREKLMSAKGTQCSVVFINTENGEEFFRMKDATNGNQLSALGASYNAQSQTYFVYGQFFAAEDNITKDDSKGFYMQEVDLKGKVVSESYTKWEEQINGTIARKAKGDIKKNMKMYIHTVVRTSDGKVFAMGEQYRKAVSGLGIASTLLNGGNSGGTAVMKVETHDMVCLEFDNKLKFKDATIYDKNKTNVQLPSGWGAIDANRLGSMMNMYGYFDYSFTTTSSDKKTFTSCYVDYEKDKEAGSNYSIGNIGYTKDQKLVYDKIKLTSKPTSFYVYKAKPGYIAIWEYYKKEKRLTLRLEKLNFA